MKTEIKFDRKKLNLEELNIGDILIDNRGKRELITGKSNDKICTLSRPTRGDYYKRMFIINREYRVNSPDGEFSTTLNIKLIRGACRDFELYSRRLSEAGI
ncbi:MAG: hypothetical protein WC584_04280 [Candidatus Pacearchaeota archaeon]